MDNNNNTTFRQYLQSAFAQGPMATDEAVAFVLPLFEEVLSFHDNSLVGSFEKPDTIFLTNHRLDIDENYAHAPIINKEALQQVLDADQIAGYTITGRLLVDEDVAQQQATLVNLQVAPDAAAAVTRPVYIPGYECYEIKIGHHDAQTDIFCLGLILGSCVMGLDLYDAGDLNTFARYREQPAGINARMHPAINALVTEMTMLDRNQRLRDLNEAIQRLKYYRDYDPQQQEDLSQIAALQIKKPADRKAFIMSRLRNRLFDTSRRNRMLYYKPNSRFVNLTISSVPTVLHYQSINPQMLFTWNEEISKKIIGTADISLNKYLRFEDHPYLNTQLNSIRLQSETDKKEFGFSQLKLVVAFLHWHNLKEKNSERIQSPLLLLPVSLERKKSLKEERYTLKVLDNAAVVNPVLANYLKDLYGIELPESIDFDDVSMEQFFALLQSKINEARQGVKLNYIDKPRIKIIHTIARQTIANYQRRLKIKSPVAHQQVAYSYSHDNYKPLGLELFKLKIQPTDSELEYIITGSKESAPPPQQFAAVKSSFQVADGDNNEYSWDFDVCNVVLGNFNYKKMSLVSDYNTAISGDVDNAIFNGLFTAEPRQHSVTPIINTPAEWHHVIAADPTQSKAVLQSRTGESYIIQGPPGTGKSQTITNLIADLLANNKTVLFICEKRAALDVVYHRLQQNKLAELCCYIHDSQHDKKEFYKDLKTVYEDFINNKPDVGAITSRRDAILQHLLKKTAALEQYHRQLGAANSAVGQSLRYLIERAIALEKEAAGISSGIAPDYHYWMQYGTAIAGLSAALEDTGADAAFAAHPFGNISNEIINADNPPGLMEGMVHSAHQSLMAIRQLTQRYQISPEFTATLDAVSRLVADAALMAPLAQSGNLRLIDSTTTEAHGFDEIYTAHKALWQQYQSASAANNNWINKITGQDVAPAITLAEEKEKSFFGFLNGRWRRLKKQLNRDYNFAAHSVKPQYSDVLKLLQEEYSAAAAYEANGAAMQAKYGVADIEAMRQNIHALRAMQGDKEVDYLLANNAANELALQLSQMLNTMQQLEAQLKNCLYQWQDKTIAGLADELQTISSNRHLLQRLLPSLRQIAGMPHEVQNFIRKIPVTPAQAEAAMAMHTLNTIYEQNPAIAITGYSQLQQEVIALEAAYNELLAINSEYIRAKRRAKFLQNYETSNASLSVLPPELKDIKKVYTEGRKILEREMNKTIRHKSIREIASQESGTVVKDIKPVWLMSPLSVSDSLPMDSSFFDVVIFDEASQITLEEGVPALFRAPQTIIVGDDKQMPPSNFFNARVEDPNDLEVYDGEAEDEIIGTDADSLLVQGARKLGSTMLSWHYRSRHEALISYSNHAFYQGRLLTIPDSKNNSSQRPLLEVDNIDTAADNVALLLNSSISFHYLPQGLYESRGNRKEAQYIALLLRSLLMDKVQESVGIVAFSQEQQALIEAEIDALATTDAVFDELLEKAYNRSEHGQFTGVFIKNLENVQGDERDIIIMSICYGFDANKKMLMNFGPINKKGGEKRLNVIFSRAKKHMAVISSIRHYHITTDHNPGANYFKRFLQYAELVSTGNMQAAQGILATLSPGHSGAAASAGSLGIVPLQIQQQLRSRGYVADSNIGQSDFKCTLAVKANAADTHYSLAILVDDDRHYTNNDVMEQYYQRPAILKSFGWKVMSVYAKDWLENKEQVMQQLLSLLAAPQAAPQTAEAENAPATEPVKPENGDGAIKYILPDKNLFWQIKTEGNRLTINSGKAGMQGQVLIKTFDTPAEATAAAAVLVQAQEAKGYLPAG